MADASFQMPLVMGSVGPMKSDLTAGITTLWVQENSVVGATPSSFRLPVLPGIEFSLASYVLNGVHTLKVIPA